MTIEQILANYLYRHKVVTLPGIGKIELTDATPDPELTAKNKQITLDGIVFTDNASAPLDDNFVAFFAEQRGKMKSLAVSDIESHLQLARQMINIGNHYEIPGIGTISKQRNGKLVLVPGAFVNPSAEPAEMRAQVTALLDRRLPENTEDNEQEAHASAGMAAKTKRILQIAAILLLVATGGWMIYHYYPLANVNTTAQAPASDTIQPAKQQLTLPNTPEITANSTLSASNPDTLATLSWKAIIREFDTKEEALRRYRTFSKMATPVFMETADSINFRMYVMLQSAIADTALKVDSLSKFYAWRVKLEKVTKE